MRIPNTAEVLTFFAAIGRFSNLPGPGADSELSLAPADADYADYADSEFSLIPAGADLETWEYSLAPPACVRTHTVKPGESCNSIAALTSTPTYQIICENAQINGKCTNLDPGKNICLGRNGLGGDCRKTAVIEEPGSNAESIAKKFKVPPEVFKANNGCYIKVSAPKPRPRPRPGKGRIPIPIPLPPKKSWVCPKFHVGSVVCTEISRVKNPEKCPKIF